MKNIFSFKLVKVAGILVSAVLAMGTMNVAMADDAGSAFVAGSYSYTSGLGNYTYNEISEGVWKLTNADGIVDDFAYNDTQVAEAQVANGFGVVDYGTTESGLFAQNTTQQSEIDANAEAIADAAAQSKGETGAQGAQGEPGETFDDSALLQATAANATAAQNALTAANNAATNAASALATAETELNAAIATGDTASIEAARVAMEDALKVVTDAQVIVDNAQDGLIAANQASATANATAAATAQTTANQAVTNAATAQTAANTVASDLASAVGNAGSTEHVPEAFATGTLNGVAKIQNPATLRWHDASDTSFTGSSNGDAWFRGAAYGNGTVLTQYVAAHDVVTQASGILGDIQANEAANTAAQEANATAASNAQDAADDAAQDVVNAKAALTSALQAGDAAAIKTAQDALDLAQTANTTAQSANAIAASNAQDAADTVARDLAQAKLDLDQAIIDGDQASIDAAQSLVDDINDVLYGPVVGSVYTKNGATYSDNGDGTWSITSSIGSDLGDTSQAQIDHWVSTGYLSNPSEIRDGGLIDQANDNTDDIATNASDIDALELEDAALDSRLDGLNLEAVVDAEGNTTGELSFTDGNGNTTVVRGGHTGDQLDNGHASLGVDTNGVARSFATDAELAAEAARLDAEDARLAGLVSDEVKDRIDADTAAATFNLNARNDIIDTANDDRQDNLNARNDIIVTANDDRQDNLDARKDLQTAIDGEVGAAAESFTLARVFNSQDGVTYAYDEATGTYVTTETFLEDKYGNNSNTFRNECSNLMSITSR